MNKIIKSKINNKNLNMKTKKLLITIDMLILLSLSIIVTVPVFWHGNFPLTYDGKIYLGRIQQVYESLRNFHLPSEISFIGQDHNLGSMTAMYPWLSSLIFILPLFIIKNGLYSFALGFILLNFITGLNFYMLSRFLSGKRNIRFLGVVLYIFNSYHLEEMFVRNAIGEALAYAFFPLVALGLFQIWNRNNCGILNLSLGMICIANSHILSLFFTILILVVLEISRALIRKLDKEEIVDFSKAILLTILGSIYMIYQIIHIVINNRNMTTASRFFNYISPSISFNEMITNHLKVLFNSWNIGLIAFLLLLFFVIESLIAKNTEDWVMITWIALISLLFSFGIFHLPNKLFFTFQFAGRIYCLTVLCVSLVVVIYFNRYKTNVFSILILLVMTISLGVSAILNYKINPTITDPAELTSKFNKSNYYSLYYYSGCKDYTLNLAKGKYRETKVKWTNSNANSATYKVKETGKYLLPMSAFNKVHYDVLLNGKKVKTTKVQNRFLINTSKENNIVNISARAPFFAYLSFFISMIVSIYIMYKDIIYI